MAAREGFPVFGLDSSPTALQIAENRFRTEGLTGSFHTGGVDNLTYPDNSFLRIIDRACLTHNTLSTVRTSLLELNRVLSPGGRMISFFFGDHHPDRLSGLEFEPNTYNSFHSGYFLDIGTTYFLPASQLREFYAPLVILSARRVSEACFTHDGVPQQVNDYWIVELQPALP